MNPLLILIVIQFASIAFAHQQSLEVEGVYGKIVSSYFLPSVSLEFDKDIGYHLKVIKEIPAHVPVYNHSLNSICTIFEDFPTKEIVAKQFLSIISGDEAIKLPLSSDLSVKLSVYLQAFRYLIALYADESILKGSSCSTNFTQYLRMAMKLTDNVYNWPSEDISYLQNFSPRYVHFDNPEQVFNKLKSQVQLRGLAEAFLHAEDFKRLYGLVSYRGIQVAYRDWLKTTTIDPQEDPSWNEFNENYLSQSVVLIPGLELLAHIQPKALNEIKQGIFSADVTVSKGFTHYSTRKFNPGDIYGCNLLKWPDNLNLLAHLGYVLDDNIFDLAQGSIRNFVSKLKPEVQSIAKIVKYWEESYVKDEPIKEKTLYFDFTRDAPNNRLLNYFRLLQLNTYNGSKSTDDLLSSYRNSATFFPENEIRALAGYQFLLKQQLASYPMSMEKLHETFLDIAKGKEALKDKEETKELYEKMGSMRRRENIIKASIGVLNVYYQHLEFALMKLGIYNFVKLEKTIERSFQ